MPSDRWGSWIVRREFRSHESFTDPGERVVLDALRDELRGGRILDLGIGLGRTAAFLSPLASHYVGSDLSPGMVAGAHEAYPELDIRVVDARDLSQFPDASFDAVVFSFNGIDAVDRDGRRAVLDGVARVLAAGGLAWISMLNLDNHTATTKPTLRNTFTTGGWTWRRPFRLATQLAFGPIGLVYYPLRARQSEEGDGWARRPLIAHQFRFLVHFTRFDRGVAELRAAGLEVERAVGSDGSEIDLATTSAPPDFFHFVARKR